MRVKFPRASAAMLACLVASCAVPVPERAQFESATTLTDAIDRASRAYSVPREVLMAVAWAESRWIDPGVPGEDNGQAGVAHAGVEIGPLHLRHGANEYDVLARALSLLRIDEPTLRANLGLQVAGAAAVLADLGARTGANADDVDSWAGAVAQYSGIRGREAQVDYARFVWEAIRQGRRETAFTGESLHLAGREGATIEQLLGVNQIAQFSTDYGPARWVPASSSNYTGGRGGSPVQYVVIHTMQGSYAGSISWFQNPAAMASAHYNLRSSDGEATQMVREGDTAWHAGNWFYNQHSVGIEHEGFVADPGRWYTEAMYVASARLTRALCDRYRIPIDRQHIIGHYQIPSSGSGAPCSEGATGCGGAGHHTDPGNGGTAWNWSHYMDLVRGGGAMPMPMYDAVLVTVNYPHDMMSGERAVAYVEYRNTGTAGWDTTNTRIGTTAPRDHAGRFYDMVNWLNTHRPSAVDRATSPGSTGRFSFMIQAPTVTSDTTVSESYGLVQEAVAWFGPADSAVTFTVRVHAPPVAAADAGANDAQTSQDASAPDDAVSQRDAGPVATDASASDAPVRAGDASGDARRDGGTAGMPRGGCGCRTVPVRGGAHGAGLIAAGLALAMTVRRRLPGRSPIASRPTFA